MANTLSFSAETKGKGLLSTDGFEHLHVCLIHYFVAEGFQVDSCGAFAGVAHGFANGCYGYFLVSGDACP